MLLKLLVKKSGSLLHQNHMWIQFENQPGLTYNLSTYSLKSSGEAGNSLGVRSGLALATIHISSPRISYSGMEDNTIQLQFLSTIINYNLYVLGVTEMMMEASGD